MSLSKEAEQSLAAAVSGWFKNFAGTSALDVASDLSINHTEVMRIFEQLADADYGSLNKSVQLCPMSFDPNDISSGFKYETVTTHIFFPSKEILLPDYGMHSTFTIKTHSDLCFMTFSDPPLRNGSLM